jgi:hypothetical protein
MGSVGSYVVFAALVFFVFCGLLFAVVASRFSDESADPVPVTSKAVVPFEKCEVLIVGAGVGGLYTAYLLSGILGSKVCLVDDRKLPGGKVQSVPVPGAKNVWAPTCAEQFRDIDVQLRCLTRDLKVNVWVRGEVSLYYHNYTHFASHGGFERTDGNFIFILMSLFVCFKFVLQMIMGQNTW